MPIFLRVKKVVDVNHLRSSMLIFSLLVPHPTNVCHLVGRVLLFYWKSFFSIRQSICIYLYIFLYVISIAIWLSALQFFFWLSLTESENEFTRFHFLASFQVHLHCKLQIVQFFCRRTNCLSASKQAMNLSFRLSDSFYVSFSRMESNPP